MNIWDAIDKMKQASGLSGYAISKAMGKNTNFFSAMQYNKNKPLVETLAGLAKATGFELILKGHGEELVIDPPEVSDADSN